MNLLSKYEENFIVNSSEYTIDEGRFIIDKNKTSELSDQKSTLCIDIDYTILDTTKLKEAFTHAFEQYNVRLTPDVVLQTYNQAKDSENFYHYKKHLELLADEIASSTKSKTEIILELDSCMNNSISSQSADWIYENIRELFTTYRQTLNIIVMTSGMGEFQRMKLATILDDLQIKPELILFVEKLHKGRVIKTVFDKDIFTSSMNHKGITVLDDNVSELEDIYTYNPDKNIKLIRIKQPNGNYNHKTYTTTAQIHEIDCTVQSQVITL